MSEDLYIALIYKKLQGQIEADELEQLKQWLLASPDNQLISDSVEQAWALSGRTPPEPEIDLDADFAMLEERIDSEEAAPAKVRSLPSRFRWLGAAAAVLVLIAIGFLLQNPSTATPSWTSIACENTDCKRLKIDLPDGSTAWLDANSRLEYASNYEAVGRQIKLHGNAFFDVKRDEAHPFSVESTYGKVTVLGTSFGISDFGNDGGWSVDVATGKVAVEAKQGQQQMTLNAGESSHYNPSEQVLAATDSDNAFSWHTKRFKYKDTALGEAIKH